MSLTTTEKITFSGTSTVDGVVCERFSASIDPDNPENLIMTFNIADKDGYRDNRKQCHKDQAAFEDDVYAQQAAMIEQNAKTEETA